LVDGMAVGRRSCMGGCFTATTAAQRACTTPCCDSFPFGLPLRWRCASPVSMTGSCCWLARRAAMHAGLPWPNPAGPVSTASLLFWWLGPLHTGSCLAGACPADLPSMVLCATAVQPCAVFHVVLRSQSRMWLQRVVFCCTWRTLMSLFCCCHVCVAGRCMGCDVHCTAARLGC
jgi:hypothetical protein